MIVEKIEQVRREHGVGQIKALCRSVGLAPTSYYRLRGQLDEPESEADVELRSAIQRIAMDWPSYGYRRITAELGRQGLIANHKLVLRPMRQDNLLST